MIQRADTLVQKHVFLTTGIVSKQSKRKKHKCVSFIIMFRLVNMMLRKFSVSAILVYSEIPLVFAVFRFSMSNHLDLGE